MKHTIPRAFIYFLMLLFCGCTNHASKPVTADLLAAAPEEGKAIIVTYRKTLKPGHLTVENFIGDRSLGKLRNNEFSWIHIEPGEHILKTRWQEAALIPTTERTIQVQAGQYYLLEMRGGVGIAVLPQIREFKPTSTSLKSGDYLQALKWLGNCCQLIRQTTHDGI